MIRPDPAANNAGPRSQPQNTTRNRTGLWLLIVLLAIVGGTIVLILAGKKPESLPVAPTLLVPVRTEAVLCSDVPEIITFAGRIEADPTVTLAFDLGGTVSVMGADKGMTVNQGQVLITLDDRLQDASLDKAQTGLKQADDELKRFAELRKTGAVSESDYDGIKAHADMAMATLKEAKAYYDKCRILSPISGVVEDRMINVGEFAAPGMPVLRVANLAKLKILIDAPERDVFSLKTGQDVPVQVDALPGRQFSGKVSYVAASADSKSNTFRVEITVGNPEGTLRPGVIAKVALTRRILTSAMSVSLASLIPSKGQYIAYVVKDGHAVRRVVKLVAIVGSRAVIMEGIHAGESVIVEGQRLASDGIAVEEIAAGKTNSPALAGKTQAPMGAGRSGN
ncbi:MAG: efflux RND transporter periplasmic adaptor subunit [bacterium]